MAASPRRTDRWTSVMVCLLRVGRSRQCPHDEDLGKRDNYLTEHLEALGHVMCSSQPQRASACGAYGWQQSPKQMQHCV